MQGSSIAILQIVVATTGAYAFAHYVLGHPAPLLAATVCVSSLGLVRDARPRRVLETVLGMLVGILVAELLLLVAGPGWWQIALALGLTLIVARFLSAQASFAIAAAIQALIVMVIPANAPFLRLVDGIVGGIAALLVTALIPRTLQREEVRTGAAVYRAMDSAMSTMAQALRRGDRMRAERGLEKARALQPLVDGWSTSLDSGIAIARISPFLHRQPFGAATARAHPSVHRPRDAQSPGHRRAGWSTSATTGWPGRSRQTLSPTWRGRLSSSPQSLDRHLDRAHRARSGAQRGGSP